MNYTVLAVATHKNEALARFEASCHRYGHPLKILGMGQPWVGGDMSSVPGGGQKILLLHAELASWSSEKRKNTIIVFTDSYDVIVNDTPDNVLDMIAPILEDSSAPDDSIIFAAEMFCWPDKSLKDKYPPSPTKFRFLNSGGFIGRAERIFSLIDLAVSPPFPTIKASDDDQLFYTRIFLTPPSPSIICLDYHCRIFQALNGTERADFTLDPVEKFISSKVTSTRPAFIHGNGPAKLMLNAFANTIIDSGPSIFLFDPSSTPSPIIAPDLNIVQRSTSSYHNLVPNFLNSGADFLLLVNSSSIAEFFIPFDKIVSALISKDKEAVAPLLRTAPPSSYANFWGDVAANGYYRRSEDYFEILTGHEAALFNVPYISTFILLRRSLIVRHPDIFDGPNTDKDIQFAANMRRHYEFMFLARLETLAGALKT